MSAAKPLEPSSPPLLVYRLVKIRIMLQIAYQLQAFMKEKVKQLILRVLRAN